jgi:hypothetical protein
MPESSIEVTAEGAPPGRPQVIYVMGAGRSGSTILGVALGNYEGVFYAGEMDAWLARSGEPMLDGSQREEFWQRVRSDVPAAGELFGRQPELAIERSASLFRVHKWPARRRIRRKYRLVAQSLYDAVARAAGTMFLVDTSHYPLRARELQALTGIDLYLLYLVRDPRSVVSSFARTDVAQYKKPFLVANVYLWLTNLLSTVVFLRHPRERRMFVRYEDVVADPEGVLGDVLRRVGAPAAAPDFSALRTGIPFQGNRLIRSESIALDANASPPSPRGPLTALLQLPWTIVLGRLRPRVRRRVARRQEVVEEVRAVTQ